MLLSTTLSPRSLTVLLPLAVLGIAFTTRASQSLGYDELFTLWVSSRSWGDLIHQANLDGFTPPLFYGLVKLLSLAGFQNEDLRVLPVIFAGLAGFLGFQACERLFGAGSRTMALLVIPGSAYLFSFSHELRPYSALLACALFFLGQLGGAGDNRSDVRAGWSALLATAFSYLGMFMVALWVLECRRRLSTLRLAGMSLAALTMSAPGIVKAAGLAIARIDSRAVWWDAQPALSATFFGLSPVPSTGWIEIVSLILLASLLVVAHRCRELPALRFLVRTFLACTAILVAFDSVVPIGFAPRYFALPMSALLLLLVGVLSRMGRLGPAIALLLLGMNGIATFRYLTVRPPPREDWREAMTRLEKRLGPGGVLLAFPFHHAAVAAHVYSPGLRLGGGYTSRTGPVFWYDPPASFRGYAFEGLRRRDDTDAVLRGLASASDLCLLSDEPDVTKIASVFAAFERLPGVAAFATGDSRLRALCRPKG